MVNCSSFFARLAEITLTLSKSPLLEKSKIFLKTDFQILFSILKWLVGQDSMDLVELFHSMKCAEFHGVFRMTLGIFWNLKSRKLEMYSKILWFCVFCKPIFDELVGEDELALATKFGYMECSEFYELSREQHQKIRNRDLEVEIFENRFPKNPIAIFHEKSKIEKSAGTVGFRESCQFLRIKNHISSNLVYSDLDNIKIFFHDYRCLGASQKISDLSRFGLVKVDKKF